MKTNAKTWLMLLAIGALVAALAGCSDDDDPMDPQGGGMDLGEGAMLRVVHASPDAPAVDVYAEGAGKAMLVVEDLEYLETTPYLDLAPGSYNIMLRAAGASASSPPAFETGALTIPQDAVVTAAAVGLLGSVDAADGFRVLPLVESFTAPAAGQAAVRIVHAGADAPAVALDVGNDASTESEAEVPASAFGRFAETGAAGVALPAGANLNIGIWAGGGRVTSFTTPALANETYFIIATGLLGSTANAADGFGLLAIGPEGTIGLIRQDPVVYALHAGPDAPAVDIYVGGSETELVDNLSFGELSPPVQVPPAAYNLDFRVWDGGAVAATVATPELAAGERYLAVAAGFVGDTPSTFTLLPYGDEFGAPSGAGVRVVHASQDAPTVDVGVWDGMTFTPVGDFQNLAFGDASAGAGTDIAPGNLTIGVAGAGSTSPVATFDLGLTAGLKAFAVASGSFTGKGLGFRLLVVDASASPWQVATVLPN